MTVSDIAMARVDKAEDNSEIRPTDLIRAILGELEAGVITPKSAYVVITEDSGEIIDHHRFRANMTWEEENLLLDLAKRNLLARYAGESG